MASILFVDYQTVIPASWLNDVNAMVYSGTVPANTLTVNNLVVNTSLSGSGVTALFASPPAIGGTAANTGKFTSLTDSGLTSGRVTYASTGGLLTDSANMTFNGTTLTVTNLVVTTSLSGTGVNSLFASPPAIGGTAANTGKFTSLTDSGLTSGRVTYASTGGLLTDSANFVFDGTNVGIGTSSPAAKLEVSSGNILLSNNQYLAFKNSSGSSIASVLFSSTNDLVYGPSGAFIGSHRFYTSGAEFVRIDSSGRVLIGTTSASGANLLQVNSDASIHGLTVGLGGGSVANSVAFGVNALGASNTGDYNSAIGTSSLVANTSGSANTAIGRAGLNSNTTGSFNFSGGFNALLSNTTGSSNVAVGSQSLQSNTTASNNTAVGYQAGYSNTGGENTYFGRQSGYLSTGNFNTFVGSQVGYNSTGSQNTFVGGSNGSTGSCGQLMTTGSKNTILGNYTGNQGSLDIRTANNYIVLSDGDGNPRQVIDANGNLLVGTTNANYSSKFSLTSTATTSAIGIYTSGTGGTSGYLFRAGDDSNNTIFVFTNGNIQNKNNSYGAISDESLKENIVDTTPKLNDLLNVKVRNFNLKSDESKTKQIGVIAQELETVFPAMVETDADGIKGVKYSVFVPMLIKAIQELKAELDATKAEVAALKQGN